MALCFWAGTHVQNSGAPSPVVTNHHPVSGGVPDPVLYTPESGVQAAWYSSSDSGGSVIVLDGVAAIPDSFEVPDTAAVEQTPSTTADLEH